MKTNSNYRRLAWSYSNSPSLEDFINKKLGAKKLYSWEYINEESVKIFTISEDNENAYDSIEQIKEQLTKEGIKNFTL
jgi:hypothetical protein